MKKVRPILLRLDGLALYAYGFLIAVGFILGFAYTLRRSRRQGIPDVHVVDLLFLILLSSIVGSRGLFILVNPELFRQNPIDMFKVWEGGLVFYGGLILAVLVSLFYLRKNHLPVWGVADLFTPAIALGLFFGRMGCLMAGCCYGVETTLPWAITFTDPEGLAPLHTPVHPTQLYEAIGGLSLFLLLRWKERRKAFEGQIFFHFLLLYSAMRFLIEFLRGDPRGTFLGGLLSTSQGIGIFLALASLFMLFFLKKRSGGRSRWLFSRS